jgi:hypothetical protein
VRNDAAAKERRRQRALARQAPQPEPGPEEPKYRTPDTVDDMLAFARELGWTAERKRNGYLLKHPSGQTASLHLTMSDVAAWRNLRCQLLRPIRRNGSTSD